MAILGADGNPISSGVGDTVSSVGRSSSTALKFVAAIIAIAIAIVIWTSGTYIANWVSDLGQPATSTPINPPSGIVSAMNILLKNNDSGWTWEALIIRLAIFIILLFAIGDILMLFSSFTELTSYIIALGLALIAGAAGAVNAIAGLFAFASALSSIGIVIIILAAIFSAITLNLGIGGFMRKWRLERWAETEAIKTAKGTNKVKNAISGLADIQNELKKVS